ncbi:MAG: glutamine synthetase beta-grasp domain-containing protein, partial [Thermodesulfobacteriota bacterium]
MIKSNNIEFVDIRFLDFVGMWQHFTIPSKEVDKDTFDSGLGFDGSSIRGWQSINASDMLVVPDATTARIDPFMTRPTMAIICDIEDPITREAYSRDPRNISKKALSYLKRTGIA